MSLSLRSISDHELLNRTHHLVAREREITLEVLLHLTEIELRKLHLREGYSTMFEYCTAALGYSASAAMRRIQAARCIGQFPEVHGLLASNDINLSTICLVAKYLTPENKTDLLPRIKKKSQREVEAIVAEQEPLAALPRDRVRTVVVRVPAQAAASNYRNGNKASEAHSTDCSDASSVRGDHEMSAVADGTIHSHTNEYYRNGNRCAEPETMKLEQRSVIQFSASEAFTAKLAKVRALAAHRLPANALLEQVFELALDCFIEKEDPKRRQERREARGASPRAKAASGHSARSIAVKTRDEVFVRDKQRCSYVARNGKQCESSHALQVDHIEPVARGGSASLDNLRLLCAKHNRLEAERLMGRSGPPGWHV